MIHSFSVTLWVTALSVLTGVLLAWLMNSFRIRGRKTLEILIIISMLSPPFIGAYSWVILGGRSGVITRFLTSLFGVHVPSVYGFGGILLVLTLKLFPFIYLYVSGAIKKIDSSLLEAAEGLGCSPVRKLFTVVLPLILPTLLAGALLVFMNALADFGTPMLIGEGYQVMPVLIYSEFVGEMGGEANFAAAMATLMILITGILFAVQKYVINRKSFTMSALRPLRIRELTGWKAFPAYLFIYGLVFLALIPQLTVIFTSFLETRGSLFTAGFSLKSYQMVFRNMWGAISNTFIYGAVSLLIIILLSILLAYVFTRRRNFPGNVLDSITMFPYIIPGSVLGITLLFAFNSRPLLLSGSAAIIIIAFVIRRLPYTLRSSTAILYQISPGIEEAGVSLGCPPVAAFFRITAVMMLPGVLSGAVLSWITVITELSASVILYTGRTKTVPVAIYTEVIRASYGTAAALSSLLTLITLVSLLIFFSMSGKKEIGI